MPYPKRDAIHFERVAAAPDITPPDALAYEWAIDVLDGTEKFEPDAAGCVEIGRIGLGCALLSRAGLERMTAYYRSKPFDAKGIAARFLLRDETIEVLAAVKDEEGTIEDLAPSLAALIDAVHVEAQRTPSLEYDDDFRGKKAPTVGLFFHNLVGRKLYAEDKSFCNRWRAMGERVWLYLGAGSPATHHGSHAYVGRLEAFGLKRAT